MNRQLSPNSTVSHYRIVSKIGEGGMGEVYLAQDTKLDRKVALKFLPVDVAAHQDRMRRFVQEAKAASALNHPNIITIYEIERIDEVRFIATEFIDGETLRQRMKNAPLKLGAVLDVATQIASALAAAHAADIVHRDIKPENVMLRRDGIVKVLDFGLAKLIQASPSAVDTQAATKPLIHTEPGRVMGTVAYMSPEQVHGHDLDARTDIWSLGVVLYEMIAGQPPFVGETSSHIGVSILEKEPAPISSYAPQSPPELQRIIRKSLAKDRDDRYQTVRDLLIDLKNLRRELEIQSELERSSAPTGELPRPDAAETTSDPRRDLLSKTTGVADLRLTSSAEYLITKIKRHKMGISIALTAVVMIVIGSLFSWNKLVLENSSDRRTKAARAFQNMETRRLTSTGKAVGAAISPDGKWLVHVIDDGGQQSLWLRQVAVPNSNTQIVPPADVQYWGLAFSPDGNYVYYTAREKNAGDGSLYQMPVLGGTVRKLTTGVNSSVAFSPDGKQMAYFAYFFGDEDRLMIANADGTGERQLAVRRGGEYFFWEAFSGVSWSPDGKTLASLVGNSVENYMSVATVSVASGEIKSFTPRRWRRVRQVRWLGDGSRLLVTAQEQGTDTFNIWQLSYPAGEAQKLTNDLNSYSNISLTSDSRLLAAVQTEQDSNIWVLPAFDVARARQITQGRNFAERLAWTPDGKIVYASNASGSPDLYSIDARGGNPSQLTTDSAFDSTPCVSPDGRYVVFASDRAGTMHIWRMDINGANAKQLTDNTDDEPNLSPDGGWIVYTSCTNKCTVWKVAIDGGEPVQITDKKIGGPIVSPDGMQIAGFYFEPNVPIKYAILSFEDGQLIRTFARAPGEGDSLRWTADGRAIVYVITRGGVSNLWAQPVDGSPPKQLTNFSSDRIFGFDISRDGKQLALARGTQASDVVLISDFEQ